MSSRPLVEKRPNQAQLSKSARKRKAQTIAFVDHGIVPNNARWPLIIYKGAVALPKKMDPAAVIDRLFEENGWGRSWRDSICDFVHYHSQVNEVLGVARGHAVVEFGGIKGKRLSLRAGDVAVLPAGTGHRLIEASRDFLVVGAYPPSGTYDECTDSRDRPDAIKRIAKVKKPQTDPVYGAKGGLVSLWKSRKLINA